MWINGAASIHRFLQLSTAPVDNCRNLWTSGGVGSPGHGPRLWINLWIRGVESVDKTVDKTVDNPRLWITRGLSTICPQENRTYPQILPQAWRRVFGIGKKDLIGYPHIHSPYYYY
jgi:hypothetical protein